MSPQDAYPLLLAWRIRWCLFGPLGALLMDPVEPFRLSPDELVDQLVTSLTPAITAPNLKETP